MRKRFEQQTQLGRLLIQDTPITTAKRTGALPKLCAALKEIFVTPKWNEKVFEILEKKILSANNHTGRRGMDLWQLFVLSQVRLCQNISYDDLHHVANNDLLIRQLLGIEATIGFERPTISYQNIIDNVGLLHDKTVRELNEIIVDFGHGVFKKKEEEALRLKTDSFVVESNVHFPTDYNLLWGSARKCLDMIFKLVDKHNVPGWRKLKNWNSRLKNDMRALGKACGSGGKGKEERVKKAAESYLLKANTLLNKIKKEKPSFAIYSPSDALILMELERFMTLLEKHIDLVERRTLKGETIRHEEKVFSIFEDYTELIKKGKRSPSVEFGKNTTITTDQYHLIVDYKVMEHTTDSQIVEELVKSITCKHTVDSWSFDKGFWSPTNKEVLSENVATVVLPKKGKCSRVESEEEKRSIFKKLRHRHSAVESNINELEHRGLDRCPDKGYEHFKRYVGLAVGAYNLKKIGERLIEQERKRLSQVQRRRQAA